VRWRWLGAEIQRRKLEVETLKWTLARTQPYGLRDKKEDAAAAVGHHDQLGWW
jgi:hypothetical protein